MKERRSAAVLTTPFEKSLKKGDLPFSEYPRPAMRRERWLNLNGDWSLVIENASGKVFSGKITVPFPPESRLSGVERITKAGDTLFYSRSFSLPQNFRKEKVLLHFGAADQFARVLLNGKELGTHEGGYLPFSFDITSFLAEGENLLSVEIRDPLDPELPYGKQCKKPHGMWYTPVSGLWQTVWLEDLARDAVESLEIRCDTEKAVIRITGGKAQKKLILQGDSFAEEFRFTGDEITLAPALPRLWSPEDPFLYRFTLITGEDRVESYFALRSITTETRGGVPLLCLNHKPYHFHGVLDQGYFSDGIFLPASEEGYRSDILAMKAHGFNMLRKHIKIEPQIFYYECDRLGMVIFQDFVNAGTYSFLRDTALPTVGIKKGIRVSRSTRMKKTFLETALATQKLLKNHPCVLLYTIFNEGWGQFDADECYEFLRKADPDRLYDATSGWFWERKSDVDSHHVYFKRLKLPAKTEKPLFLSEFGGYSCKIHGHSFVEKGEYGYRFFREAAEWEKAVLKLYEDQVLPLAARGLAATVMTQLSDVEEETNGMLTYDRQLTKGEPARFAEMAARIREAFEKFASALEKGERI